MRMDQATASDLLARLGRRALVRRAAGEDRRSVRLTLTREGRALFERSVGEVRSSLRAADKAGELDALVSSMNAYLRYYGIGRPRAVRRPRAHSH